MSKYLTRSRHQGHQQDLFDAASKANTARLEAAVEQAALAARAIAVGILEITPQATEVMVSDGELYWELEGEQRARYSIGLGGSYQDDCSGPAMSAESFTQAADARELRACGDLLVTALAADRYVVDDVPGLTRRNQDADVYDIDLATLTQED